MRFLVVRNHAEARLVRMKYYQMSDALVPIDYFLKAKTIIITDKGKFAGCFAINTVNDAGYLRYANISNSCNPNCFVEMCENAQIDLSELVELTSIAFSRHLGRFKRQLAYGLALFLCAKKGKIVIGATIHIHILVVFKQVLTHDLGTASVVVEGHNNIENPIPLFICYAERNDILKEFPKNIFKKNWNLFLKWLKKVAI